ncbi:glycosyltransferase [Paenibacillus agri]|nr:glycosyltransferase [Paenibacillus agri]
MDEKKICFITCLNDEVLYEESVRYIHSLNIPNGFQIELIAIREARSMAEGYNHAMKQSDAKYKVYLHQDTFIINKDFILDIVNLFNNYHSLGMLGVIGAKNIPTNGVWWKSSDRYGKVYDNSRYNEIAIFQGNYVRGDYETVDAVDGLILITQYDLGWREDLFKAWQMYDMSQAFEFRRAGYEVGVAKQNECWCIHDCNSLKTEEYEYQREVFLEEYSKDVFPLVSVLIPTYNRPELLQQALESVINQTYKNIEIIICDDSTNFLTYTMMQAYINKYPNIIYIKNEERQEINNWQKCLELAQGKYINYLMDDDLFALTKVEKMVDYFLRLPNLKLATSYRRLIDEFNNELPDRRANVSPFQEDTVIKGYALGNVVLKNLNNMIGEPSTVMFKREDVEFFGKFKNKSFFMLNDLATWLALLSKGTAVYIAEPLSYFRQHAGQNQRNLKYLGKSIPDWYNLIDSAHSSVYLKNIKDYKTTLQNYITHMMSIVQVYNQEHSSQMLLEINAASYISTAANKLLEYPDTYCCNFCESNFDEFKAWSDKFDSDRYDYEMYNKFTAICPVCGCFDRERLIRFYIDQLASGIDNKHKLLHIAPESNLRRWLENEVNTYIAGDLFPSDLETQKIDITDISYENDSFDVVICSHVLEHVPDDTRALKEFYRVLKPGGWGILQVPIALNIDKTYEDASIVTPEDRLEAFGQEDHVRMYARDYVDRLLAVGFSVEVFNIFDRYGLNEAIKYGLSEQDNLYVVHK